MIIQAETIHSCSSELSNIDKWAYASNNLQPNSAKSAEIIFVKPRTRRLMPNPPSLISGFTRVESIKILGVISPVNFPSRSMSTISWPDVPSHYLLYVLSDNTDYRMTPYVQCSRQLSSTNSVTHLQPGGGSPPQTIVIAWKHLCILAKLGYHAISSATFAMYLHALMPTINCLLDYPGTASTCYIRSFLLSVNSITVFATEVTTTNFLTEPLLLMTITS